MKLLCFSGSLRKASLNKKLLKVEMEILKGISGVEVAHVDLQELQFPVYDGDIEAAGIPPSVRKFGELIQEARGLIIASPEYNGSISSPLKNAVDWVSRLKPMPLEKKPVLLTGASPGGFGTVLGLRHARAPFEKLGNFVHPQSFPLSKAGEAFTPDGDLVDAASKQRLVGLLTEFVVFARMFS